VGVVANVLFAPVCTSMLRHALLNVVLVAQEYSIWYCCEAASLFLLKLRSCPGQHASPNPAFLLL